MRKILLALSEQGLSLKTAPLGATKLTKVNDQQTNLLCLYLFSSFIACPALPCSFFIFSPLPRARKLWKARGVILVSSTPQIHSLFTKFSKMAVFLSSDPSKLVCVPLVFSSKSPFKLNIKIKVS